MDLQQINLIKTEQLQAVGHRILNVLEEGDGGHGRIRKVHLGGDDRFLHQCGKSLAHDQLAAFVGGSRVESS